MNPFIYKDSLYIEMNPCMYENESPWNPIHITYHHVVQASAGGCVMMTSFSSSLALCAGNSPVTGGFPSQRPVTQSFDVFFDLHLNKQLSKQSKRWWFETLKRSLWRHCNVEASTRGSGAALGWDEVCRLNRRLLTVMESVDLTSDWLGWYRL